MLYFFEYFMYILCTIGCIFYVYFNVYFMYILMYILCIFLARFKTMCLGPLRLTPCLRNPVNSKIPCLGEASTKSPENY